MQVAFATAPKVGELANGDQAFHREDREGRVMLAVIDGLGHGPEAQAAAMAALGYLGKVSLDSPLKDIMSELHQAMRGTRGAAGTVCVGSGDSLSVCAVGNVDLRCVNVDVPLISSAGILGVRVTKFRICTASIKTACRLLIYSDGITNPTSFGEFAQVPPKVACDGLLQRHRRSYDDATVLIADLE